MCAIRLGALQQRYVTQIPRDRLEWRKEILQHRQVGLHLLAIEPAVHQPRLLVDRGVNQIGHVRHRSEDF